MGYFDILKTGDINVLWRRVGAVSGPAGFFAALQSGQLPAPEKAPSKVASEPDQDPLEPLIESHDKDSEDLQ